MSKYFNLTPGRRAGSVLIISLFSIGVLFHLLAAPGKGGGKEANHLDATGGMAFHFKAGANHTSAVVHDSESHSGMVGVGCETGAIVFDGESIAFSRRLKGNEYIPALAMFGGVGNRFLNDVIQVQGNRIINGGGWILTGEAAGDLE